MASHLPSERASPRIGAMLSVTLFTVLGAAFLIHAGKVSFSGPRAELLNQIGFFGLCFFYLIGFMLVGRSDLEARSRALGWIRSALALVIYAPAITSGIALRNHARRAAADSEDVFRIYRGSSLAPAWLLLPLCGALYYLADIGVPSNYLAPVAWGGTIVIVTISLIRFSEAVFTGTVAISALAGYVIYLRGDFPAILEFAQGIPFHADGFMTAAVVFNLVMIGHATSRFFLKHWVVRCGQVFEVSWTGAEKLLDLQMSRREIEVGVPCLVRGWFFRTADLHLPTNGNGIVVISDVPLAWQMKDVVWHLVTCRRDTACDSKTGASHANGLRIAG